MTVLLQFCLSSMRYRIGWEHAFYTIGQDWIATTYHKGYLYAIIDM